MRDIIDKQLIGGTVRHKVEAKKRKQHNRKLNIVSIISLYTCKGKVILMWIIGKLIRSLTSFSKQGIMRISTFIDVAVPIVMR